MDIRVLIFLTLLLLLLLFHKTTSLGSHDSACVIASPPVLGLKGETSGWVTLNFSNPNPADLDWIGVFSPGNASAALCDTGTPGSQDLCTYPIKLKALDVLKGDYKSTGKGTLRIRLINQREDFSFALFSVTSPKPIAVSNKVTFLNPKAPVYPRLSQGKSWNEMAVTWTSGYAITEAVPLVKWGLQGETQILSPAGTLTFSRNSMCAAPARTTGWRDPGFIHTSFLKDLWPNSMYTYKLGHRLFNGSFVWSKLYKFRASPYPGQDSLQRVVIFGDMGQAEVDGLTVNSPVEIKGALNTTRQLIQDLKNIDMVIHIGDITYAMGYIARWDGFTEQIEPIASAVPYMIGSGNHERDWPGTGSFYGNIDSGGECGVVAETMFYVPAENRAMFWYSTDYGMFRFCIADTEHDWRPGTQQYKFIEHCLASVDRQKQPWLVFLAHRVLGYSSDSSVADQGSFEEPMGRESLQELWQKYKVDISIFGHEHNYERTCPIYENICTSDETSHYTGALNGTIHIVAGGAGAELSSFSTLQPNWSIYRDYDYGFVKLTAFNHSSLLFEYKKSSDGKVYDSFTINRDYRDILVCTVDSCPKTTLAS